VTEQPDWRRRRWEATHERIYDAALRLFQERGFDRVNVGQIAGAAEVSVPTFYAHYSSKEHVLMLLPAREDIAAVVAVLPQGLPLGERLKAAVALFLTGWDAEIRDNLLIRWRIIAEEPALRVRAAEFERTTAEYLITAIGSESGAPLGPHEVVIVHAYMAAYTAGLLAWARSGGERAVQDLIDEAFDALRGL
jgi:AcrR family transcriptional regulator